MIVISALLGSVAMIATAEPVHAQFQSGGADKDGAWYAGEGLKQGDFFTYRMCHIDYKECADFEMSMWFGGTFIDGTEEKWKVDTVAYEGNRVTVGHMELGIIPEPTGGTDNLSPYRGAFKSSIVWLSAFATYDDRGGKGPKEFRANSWGKIGNIGGEQVLPLSVENIKVAGQEWEAIKIGWKTGGRMSEVILVDNFPFPIKAHTFTHVSEGIPPPEYIFELLEYKENVQENPFEGIVSTANIIAEQGCDTNYDKDAVLKKATESFSYVVNVFYGPEDPVEGCDMEWIIKFISKYDETEFLNQVQFDVLVIDEKGIPIRSLAEDEGKRILYSPSGQYILNMVIKEDPGLVNYVVWIYGQAPKTIVPSGPVDIVMVPIQIHPKSVKDSSQEVIIPEWVKNSAGWWAKGLIDDSTFVNGIKYLIENDIIIIPDTSGSEQSTTTTTNEITIPEWVKSSAGWWAEGAIDDGTFIQSIQFLIKTGIMTIS